MVEAVPEKFDFPNEEEKILEIWDKLDAFHTSLKQSKGRPRFAFYDGPPFATGLPHYGHILAGTIKDIVTRYAHQSGFYVDRRFGWDCHGLPVEYEIDKSLGIKGPEDVAKIGIAEYNKKCRSIVMRYAGDWEQIVKRLGRWIDFKNDYKTLYPWFMETIWWVFKQLYDKGFVYRGFKVMPFSTGCNTPLSNFESNQNYKDTVDPAVIINFPLDEDPNAMMIAWTTTPWTLPSNLGLCVNPKMLYVKVKDVTTGNIYILMEARLVALYKNEKEYDILEKFLGETLLGKTYKPLFPYFAHMKETGAFRILCDGYVTSDSGTGVVHQAPFFGADDYRVCLAAGVFEKDSTPVCPVDASGKFTEEVTDFVGQYVKDADKNICKHLKQEGRLVHQSTTKHNYPFCWRSETPLIYKAVPSWFVRVEQITDKLLENNAKSYWVPEAVKEKRFANWLRDAHDWAISRNRYWGTPIPLWVSDDYEEVVCIGSIDELAELSGIRITDLHRESVDHITIPSRMGKGVLRRVSEVFDCWFESGSMPYSQMHYPFENKKAFEEGFPADFIAEGIDQTRGWFYTLLVLSTALFGRPAFKNLIVNGLVLASDGQKMSKRKKNYPDPMKVIHSFGADALRLYLINSPVVRAENLRFQENGVRDILKDVFLPWYNAYRFLVQNILRLEKDEGVTFTYRKDDLGKSENTMDRWILSFTQSLVRYVKQEMAAYRLYTVVPRLVKFVDLLTNWYVRSNRRRLKGDFGIEDCQNALQSLFSVILTMTRVMSPFIPFLTEHMYQNLRKIMPDLQGADSASVHFLLLPDTLDSLIDEGIEEAVNRMQTVIELGRVIRDRNTMPTKYPLPELVVIHKSQKYLDDVTRLQRYVTEELNVRTVTFSSDKDKYGVQLRAEPDHMVLGKRLKGDFKKVTAEIKKLNNDQVEEFLRKGEIEILGHKLTSGDLRVILYSDEISKYSAQSDNDVLVLLDVDPNQAMRDEGVAREIVNRIQKLRKKAKLVPTDDVTVYYNATGSDGYLKSVAIKHADYISATTRSPFKPYPVLSSDVIIAESTQLKESQLDITLVRGHVESANLNEGPVCKYFNVQLHSNGLYSGPPATVLLENPRNHATMRTINDVKQFVSRVFGLDQNGSKVILTLIRDNQEIPIDMKSDPMSLDGATVLVGAANRNLNSKPSQTPPPSGIVCGYVNLQLVKGECRGAGDNVGTALLENPCASNKLTLEELQETCEVVFGHRGKKMKLSKSCDMNSELQSVDDVMSGDVIYVAA
uniref:Isoleucine--tRNA ligase, cytoplasmic n=1 Tax=Phallusia mammillata TaxID=59560 RepID=A0A6F9DEX2_9ASCI|nr:isoleucine--tRNA ligase, cytoplasmic [Phallusia mammillata]